MSNPKHEVEYENLTMEDLASLGKRSAEGDLAAREELILSHLNLVEQQVAFFRGQGVDDEDLFQEGSYGLIEAVDRYDYTRGTRLSSFAISWIRKRMSLAILSQSMKSPITFGVEKVYYALRRYSRCYSELGIQYGRQPTTKEIAAALNISEQAVREISRNLFSFTNLDEDRMDKGDPRPKFTPIRHCAPSAEEEAFNTIFRTEFPFSDVRLTPRQREIISRRCGFTPSGEPESVNQIAATLHISTETVRLDYKKALNTLHKALLQNSETL